MTFLHALALLPLVAAAAVCSTAAVAPLLLRKPMRMHSRYRVEYGTPHFKKHFWVRASHPAVAYLHGYYRARVSHWRNSEYRFSHFAIRCDD